MSRFYCLFFVPGAFVKDLYSFLSVKYILNRKPIVQKSLNNVYVYPINKPLGNSLLHVERFWPFANQIYRRGWVKINLGLVSPIKISLKGKSPMGKSPMLNSLKGKSPMGKSMIENSPIRKFLKSPMGNSIRTSAHLWSKIF